MPNVSEPMSGWLIDGAGNVVNIVSLLNGSSPVQGVTRNPKNYNVECLQVVAEDGGVYNLADLLKNSGGAVDELPEANADNLGRIVQYSGETSGQLVHGYFYECVENAGVYSWSPLDFGGTPVAAFSGETLVIT